MSSGSREVALLLLAYGGPLKLADVEPYLLDVRHGRPLSPGLLEEVRERYRRIGCRSPLLEVTRRQAEALERRLRAEGVACRAFVGMRHWHPYILEAVRQILQAGLDRVVALCMAPQYSSMSIGAYMERTEEACRELGAPLQISFVRNWHLEERFIEACAHNLRLGIRRLGGDGDDLAVLFTAHSLPEKILVAGDPYPGQLAETVAAVVERVRPARSAFAYQSRGQTSEQWLGPDAGQEIEHLHRLGCRRLLVHPIGFVSDHVEILYDVDIEYRRQAESLGMRFARVESCNDAPLFIEALGRVVRAHLEAAAGAAAGVAGAGAD